MKLLPLKNQLLYLALFFGILFLSSCGGTTIVQIGKVNMVSNRNVDTRFKYEPIKSYAGLSKKELKRSDSESIDEAIDKTVKSVPGGEFIMNAKVYSINNKYFAVEGDVWGNKVKEYKGFKLGSRVQWKSNFMTKTGVISSLTDDEACMVTEQGKSDSKSISYDRLTKVRE